MKLSGVLTWLLLIAIFISGPAAGFDIDRLELRHLDKEAEFVFIGTVEAIDYRTSSVTSEDEVALSHTFVTFKIQEVLKGKAATKAAPYSAPVLRAKHLLARDLNEISGMDAMASSPRAKGTPEAMVKPLVSKKEMVGVRLRGQTKGLLRKSPKALSAGETVLLNRLLLEDLYHPHLVRRLDKGLVRFPFIASETPSAVLKVVMGHEALCVDLV
ncbi:MAG: hypothetical protein KZQ88_15540 [Candidatus Thiodiazotropha sp. (ex Dulcina madagascariensis)]|nr:hypothetical protein [Candidatus Thiodiazotropha sp. (ex Dulcina madagascariensis)]MCU7928536.1 hypothetical protein [Candidatus Thiodiazotropha sp. (ex Dulcina madagascariensis)]